MISNKRCTAADIPKLCWNKIFQNGIKGGDIREKAVFEDEADIEEIGFEEFLCSVRKKEERLADTSE